MTVSGYEDTDEARLLEMASTSQRSNREDPARRAPATTPAAGAERIFEGGGEASAILRAIDWSKTPLGPVETWPQTLRTSLRICLTSRHDIIIWWGPDLLVFYNDAYAPTLGIKHPWAMGKSGHEAWREIWPVIGPMLQSVLETGQAT